MSQRWDRIQRALNGFRKIVHHLKNMGKTCITISHDMKFVAANFERVIVLMQGQILLDGTPEEVFSKPELLSRSFITPPPITRVCQKMRDW